MHQNTQKALNKQTIKAFENTKLLHLYVVLNDLVAQISVLSQGFTGRIPFETKFISSFGSLMLFLSCPDLENVYTK
jgi:hypothetical protein